MKEYLLTTQEENINIVKESIHLDNIVIERYANNIFTTKEASLKIKQESGLEYKPDSIKKLCQNDNNNIGQKVGRVWILTRKDISKIIKLKSKNKKG